MKPRRWVFRGFLLLLALWLVGLGLWYGLDLPGKLRARVLAGMEQAGLQDTRLDEVAPRLMGLELRGLAFSTADTMVAFDCRRITVSLAPLRWLFHPRQPLALLENLRLDQPRLHWSRLSSRRDPVSLAADSLMADRLRNLLKAFPRVYIRDGVLLLGPTDRELALLNHLDGLLWQAADGLRLRIESDLPAGEPGVPGSDTRGLDFRLSLDPSRLDGEFALELRRLQLGSQLLPALENHLQGVLHADARITGRILGARLDSLAGGGTLRIPGARVSGLDSLLDLDAELEVRRDRLLLSHGRLDLAGQSLSCRGWVDSTWHLDLDLEHLDLARLEDLLPGKARLPRVEGRLDLEATLRGALDHPRLETRARGGFRLSGMVCDTLRLELTAGPDSVEVRELYLAGIQGRLRAKGRLEDWRGDTRARLEGELDLPLARLDLPLAIDPDQHLALQARLLADAAGSQVEFRGSLGTAPVVLYLNGLWQDGRLHSELLDTDRRAVGELSLETGPGLPGLELRLEDLLEPLGLLLAGEAPWPADSRLAVGLQRLASQWQVDLEGRLPTLAARLDGLVGSAAPGQWALAGTLQGATRWGDPLRGSLAARLDGTRLELDSLRLLESLVLAGSLDPRARSYRLQLDSGPVPLATLLDLLPRESASPSIGEVTLLLAGEGNLDDPGLRGAIEYGIELPDTRKLNWWSPLEVTRDWVRAPEGRLSLGQTDLGTTEIGFAPDLSSGSGQLWLAELELARLLPGNPYGLGGLVSGQARLGLRDGKPRLMLAELDLAKPRVAGLAFDRMNLRAAQRNLPGEDGGAVIQLDSLVLRRNGVLPLELRVEGQMPLEQDGEMDLNATLAGDLFQLVTNDTTFIRSGGGVTEAQLRITGTPANPQVLDGSLVLHEGHLELESVFPRLRDIELDLRLEDGALEIRRFEARSGKGSLRVGNRPGWITPEGEELQPWQFLGTNLGVLTVEMGDGERYLDTVIPGLMQLDWNSEVRLRGRVPGEPFVFAGPVERPVARGTIDVRNARFTFPFIVGEKEPTPILLATVGFLNTIDWDLQVVPGRNCNYYKEIQGFEDVTFFDSFQGYLDRITVDVYLDRDTDPMLFAGQIDDGTFRILGTTTSSRGDIKYLFLNFQVDELGMEFDATSLLPVVWGTADYYVYDSGSAALPGQLGFGADSRTFFLKLVVEDEFGNQLERGRWSVISLKLEDEQGRAVEQILPELGIDPLDPLSSFQSVLPGVVAGFLPLPLTPVESRIRRTLGLDLVRISLPVLQNTAEDLLGTQKDTRDTYWNYLQGTRVTAGKELGPRYFLSWTGQLQSSSGLEVKRNLNLYQLFSLEYSVSRELSLTGDLVFDPLNENSSFKGDPRVFLRYRIDY